MCMYCNVRTLATERVHSYWVCCVILLLCDVHTQCVYAYTHVLMYTYFVLCRCDMMSTCPCVDVMLTVRITWFYCAHKQLKNIVPQLLCVCHCFQIMLPVSVRVCVCSHSIVSPHLAL